MKTKKIKCKFVKLCVRVSSFFEKNVTLGTFIFVAVYLLPLWWGPTLFWGGKYLFGSNEIMEHLHEYYAAWLPSFIFCALVFLAGWVKFNQKLKEYKKKHEAIEEYDYVYLTTICDLKKDSIMYALFFFCFLILIVSIVVYPYLFNV